METRYIEEYDGQGNVINRIPYEVSDEELLQEQLAEKFNSGHEDLVRLIKNWPTMNKAQKAEASDRFVPYCAEWMLWKDGRLHLGILL